MKDDEDTLVGLLRRCLAELVGTLVFVLFIGLSKSAGALQPLVPALALLIMKYSIGHISLASLNPANSLGLYVRGVLTMKAMLLYIVAELIGGVAKFLF
jgi:glycerol uptake facilitator-like aquaporin